MHAKVSSARSRFFAHDTLSPSCPSLGETPEHRELKRRIASILRQIGCQADLEATPSTDDHGGWRADVLATSTQGRRIAFEIQLAAMTIEEGVRRTAVYQRDGISCVWITPRHPHWFSALPACRIVDQENRLMVDRGLGRLQVSRLSWEPAEPMPFETVALSLAQGLVTMATQTWLREKVDGNLIDNPNAVLLVTTSEARALERLRQEQDRRSAEHARNRAALYERQQRLLQVAMNDAVEAGLGQILLGVPPTRWDGVFPVDRIAARGCDATGGATAIWSASGTSAPQLWAVISPVPSKLAPSLGARRYGVIARFG